MTESTASELAYVQEIEDRKLAQRMVQAMTKPTTEDSLAKIAELLEIQTMCKVAEQIRTAGKGSMDNGFHNNAWEISEDMTRKALDKMNEILDQEENHGKED